MPHDALLHRKPKATRPRTMGWHFWTHWTKSTAHSSHDLSQVSCPNDRQWTQPKSGLLLVSDSHSVSPLTWKRLLACLNLGFAISFILTHSTNIFNKMLNITKLIKWARSAYYPWAHSFWKLPVLSPHSSFPSEIYYPVFTLGFLSKVSSKCRQNEQGSPWRAHRALFIFLLGIHSTLKRHIYSHVYTWARLHMHIFFYIINSLS